MNFKKYAYLSVIVFLCFGCEDVVDINTDQVGGSLVVDAWVNSLATDQVIRLTTANEYFDNSAPKPVSNASVVLTNTSSAKNYIFLQKDNSSEYIWNSGGTDSLGLIGDEFKLKIEVDGNTYESTTSLRMAPKVDSITQEFMENEVFLDDGIYLEFFARDFEGSGDAYWIKSYKNGEYLADPQEFNIVFDAGFDAGTGIDGLIFIPPIRFFVNPVDDNGVNLPWTVDETLRVEIHSLSVEAFNFLEITRDQLQNGDNGIFAFPFANGKSNIKCTTDPSREVLGFFNVAQVTSLDYIVQ